MYSFKEEEIPRIQDQDLFLGLLRILYYRCPSGKTARFGRPSADGIDLTVDVVAVDDGNLRAIRPDRRGRHSSEERDSDKNPDYVPPHREPPCL